MAYISSASSDVSTYTPVSTAGEITYSGLGNGTDWGEVIDAEIQIESFRKEEYETRLAEQEYVVDQLEQFQDSLADYQSSLDDMDSMDEFLDVEVSGGGDEVDVSATGSAEAGTHTIVVNQLAQTDVWINTGYGFAETTDEVASADTTFSFEQNGESYSVEVQAGTTLQELVNQINADPDLDGVVQASLLDDGSNQYFVLSSAESGADNAIAITDTGSLTGITAASMENTQAACDAQIKVDGFPSADDEWITRSTNEIDDVITGLDLTLTDTTDADGVRITTSFDEDALQEKIEEFVAATNQVIYDLQVLTGKVETTYTDSDGEEQTAPTIESYALDLMYTDMKYMLASLGQGFERYDADAGTGDTYSTFSAIGITTDADEDSDTWGQLIVDEDELAEAIANDPQAVASLFAEDAEISVSGTGLTYISKVDGVTGGGEYEVEYEMSGGEILWATIDGVSMDIEGNTLLAPSSSEASGLYLKVTETGDGTYSNTVSVKQGKIGQLNAKTDDWTSSDGGTLQILIESLESSIESLEDDIYDEEQRLDQLESDLVRKYAALDSTLNNYANMEAQLEASLAQLD